MTIEERFKEVNCNIVDKALSCGRQPQEITLVAVSKGHGIDSMESVYHLGGRNFGESRLQEACEKIELFSYECRWHFTGRLQSNKVKKAISSFYLIHSVDSIELAQKISHTSQSEEIMTRILLQVNASGEKTKQGLNAVEWERQIEVLNELPNLRIEGLMTMAPYVEDEKVIRNCFHSLYELREKWKKEMREPALLTQLSMGMSHDYLLAIEEGATLLRIGTAIFGA